jgi:hypothetical protein
MGGDNTVTRTRQHDLDSDKESIRPQRGENLENWAKDIQDDSHWVIPKSPEQDNSVCLIRNIRLERLPLDDKLAVTVSAAELGINTPYRLSIEFQLGDSPRVSYNLNTNPTFVTLPPCYNAPNKQHPVHRREFLKYLRIFGDSEILRTLGQLITSQTASRSSMLQATARRLWRERGVRKEARMRVFDGSVVHVSHVPTTR